MTATPHELAAEPRRTETVTTKQKIGLGLAILYSAGSVPSVLEGAPDGEVGAPFAILVIGSLLGVVGLVAGVLAWRRHRGALRVTAAAIILQSVSAVPAFFVDVPPVVKVLVAATVLVTVAALVLMFSTERTDATARITD